MSVTASVFTSTVIAIDRYLVVTHPLKPRASRRIRLGFIWLIAVALSSVQLAVGRANTVEVSETLQLSGVHRAGKRQGSNFSFPLNFGLSENCPKILLCRNFFVHLGLKDSFCAFFVH